MKFRKFSLFAIALFMLVGCTGGNRTPESPRMQGGIGVGNGMQSPMMVTYLSPHGFSFNYPSTLRLTKENNERRVIVDNSTLEANLELQSKVELQVLPKKAESWKLFEQIVRAERPDLKFEVVEFPGARALAWRGQETNQVHGLYYFLTEAKDIIQVKLDAKLPANGLTWVAPVVKTLRFDERPPRVEKIRMKTKTVKAGGEAFMEVHVTDDLAGVAKTANVDFHFVGYNEELATLRATSKLEAADDLGKDWYRLRIPIGKWKPTGEYFLSSFEIKDRTGNATDLRVAREEVAETSEEKATIANPYELKSTNAEHPSISEVKIRIDNEGLADVIPPKIDDIVVFMNVVRLRGEAVTKEISFRATDDLSGILGENPAEACYEISHVNDQRLYRIQDCRPIKKLPEPNWYSVSFELKKSLPSGDFILGLFRIRDQAGNKTELTLYGAMLSRTYRLETSLAERPFHDSGLKVTGAIVRNEGEVDPLGPDILEIEPIKSVRAGGRGEVRFRAYDPAGILVTFDHQKLTRQNRGEFLPVNNPRSPVPIELNPTIQKIEGRSDWYLATFDVPPYLTPGRYYLASLVVVDREFNETHLSTLEAWNNNKLEQSRFDLWNGARNWPTDSGGLEIPFLQVLGTPE